MESPVLCPLPRSSREADARGQGRVTRRQLGGQPGCWPRAPGLLWGPMSPRCEPSPERRVPPSTHWPLERPSHSHGRLPLAPRDLFAHPPCRGGDGGRRPVLQDSGCRLCCRGPQLSLLAARGGAGAPGEAAPGEAHVPATLPSWAPSGCSFQPLPERPRWPAFHAAVLPALCASPALSPWPTACEAVGLVCTPRMYTQVGSGHRQGVHREGRRHARQPVRSAAFVDGAHGARRRASVLGGRQRLRVSLW